MNYYLNILRLNDFMIYNISENPLNLKNRCSIILNYKSKIINQIS